MRIENSMSSSTARFVHLVKRALYLSTALGVIIHELAHKEMCEDFGIPIREVCYFQFGTPAGYVIHAQPRAYVPTFAISVAPFLLNSGVAFTCFVIGGLALIDSGLSLTLESGLPAVGLFWLGISAGVHAFPSHQDTANIWDATKRHWTNPVALIGIPIIGLLFALDKTRRLKSHWLFTVVVAYLSYRSLSFIYPVADLWGVV